MTSKSALHLILSALLLLALQACSPPATGDEVSRQREASASEEKQLTALIDLLHQGTFGEQPPLLLLSEPSIPNIFPDPFAPEFLQGEQKIPPALIVHFNSLDSAGPEASWDPSLVAFHNRAVPKETEFRLALSKPIQIASSNGQVRWYSLWTKVSTSVDQFKPLPQQGAVVSFDWHNNTLENLKFDVLFSTSGVDPSVRPGETRNR